ARPAGARTGSVSPHHRGGDARGVREVRHARRDQPVPRLRASARNYQAEAGRPRSSCRAGALILLDHKFRRWLGDIGRMQHWHRCRVGAIATANKRWMVAIEFGTWRWGRIGGAAGSITVGNGRFFDCSGTIRSRGGNPLPLGDQKPVSCNRHRAVMVEASPGAPLIMTQADFLLEFLIIALD